MENHRGKLGKLAVAWVVASTLAAGAAVQAADLTPAQRAFERIKALEGSWKASSTMGWDGEITYRVLADGSAVLELSEIDPDDAGATMATLYHLDGDRLMLTHYCAAGNQPRMAATEFAADGSGVTFAYLDGTNLSSRDDGHMDRAVFRFLDEDRYSSRWTWYQDGQESWMEEIELERQR